MATIGSIPTTRGATTTIGATATIAVDQEFIITAVGSAIAGIVVGTIIITITLVAIFVCIRQKKQKIRGHNQWLPRRSHQQTLSSNLSGNGEYQFTPNETYNIREQVVHNDSGNSESSDLQSTSLYYDYVDNNDFTTVRTTAAFQQPEHHNFPVKRNIAYNESQQIIDGTSSTEDDNDDYVVSSYYS